MRYFTELAYNGTNYFGWQKQPNQVTVQETIDHAFSTILRKPIEVTGCGRTDTGVHARQYYIHFDFEGVLPKGFLNRINKFLPKDISIKSIFEIHSEAHARFDAHHRSYEYHLDFRKNPFQINTTYYFPFSNQLDFKGMNDAAILLTEFEEFFPFCKTNTDAKTMKCEIKRAEWVLDEKNQKMIFHISANRFLRGMVRLIVGMCLNIGLEKISLNEVRNAMETQTRLSKSLSVPAKGLFLTEIKYPYLDNS
ncbi:MAG: tRNA pseudouridine(38-40) synthase TruA [Bacteroidetes bacterium]|jgi:tRNA pseudouridine38-40 synthase|nr:tRNA pseudouridine(38-40) synthase TruA [Bacteroidota bacterium]MDF1863597.1 tRNA pseudouridine(38-40) synthase TruA [Saprospiraceae bacterium]